MTWPCSINAAVASLRSHSRRSRCPDARGSDGGGRWLPEGGLGAEPPGAAAGVNASFGHQGAKVVRYNLEHLVQEPSQAVFGPIQDDEALLLSAVCRVACAARIAEFGGESVYSARNFLAAVDGSPEGKVYTVDSGPVPVLAPNHRFIRKFAKDVVLEDFDRQPLDLVFFDCHDFAQQLEAFLVLARGGVVTRECHPAPKPRHCAALQTQPLMRKGFASL